VLEPGYADAVRSVSLRRRAEARGEPGTALTGGRLLVFCPDAELSDGAAEVQSGGYFDVCNTPPWDTWVALVTDLAQHSSRQVQLISWVPDLFIANVQAGIEVNPEECIFWLDESDVRFARLIEAARARG
jgi:hypothetical protein